MLRRFEGLPHRARFVREVNGVRWINDSNPAISPAVSSSRSATAAGDGNRETESIGCSAAAPGRRPGIDFPEIFLKPHHFRGFLRPEAFPAAKIG